MSRPPGWVGELHAGVVVAGAAAATAVRLVHPRRPDRGTSAVQDAGIPPARATVTLTPLVHATWRAPAVVVAEGDVRTPRTMPMAFVTWLVRHPETTFVIDPAVGGSGSSVAAGVTSVARRLLVPPAPVRSLGRLLDEAGVARDQVDFALATHLHFDHVEGMRDLPPEVPLRFVRSELDPPASRPRRLLGAPTDPLLPPRLEPFELTGPPLATTLASMDLLGDGSVHAVALPGHTAGSVGYLLHVGGGRRVLLVGDAVWSLRQLELGRQKAPLPGWLVDHDRARTFDTLLRIRALGPHITVVPAHDIAAARSVAPGDRAPG